MGVSVCLGEPRKHHNFLRESIILLYGQKDGCGPNVCAVLPPPTTTTSQEHVVFQGHGATSPWSTHADMAVISPQQHASETTFINLLFLRTFRISMFLRGERHEKKNRVFPVRMSRYTLSAIILKHCYTFHMHYIFVECFIFLFVFMYKVISCHGLNKYFLNLLPKHLAGE